MDYIFRRIFANGGHEWEKQILEPCQKIISWNAYPRTDQSQVHPPPPPPLGNSYSADVGLQRVLQDR